MSRPPSTIGGQFNYAQAAAGAAQKAKQGASGASTTTNTSSSASTAANSPAPSPALPGSGFATQRPVKNVPVQNVASTTNGMNGADTVPAVKADAKELTSATNGSAKPTTTAPKVTASSFKPNGLGANFDFNSLFQSRSGDTSPPTTSPTVPSSSFGSPPPVGPGTNGSILQPTGLTAGADSNHSMRKSTFDPTSPKSGQSQLPQAAYNSLPGGRPFSSQNHSGYHSHSSSTSNAYPYAGGQRPQSYNSQSQRGPQSAGPNGKFSANANPVSPRMPNGNLPPHQQHHQQSMYGYGYPQGMWQGPGQPQHNPYYYHGAMYPQHAGSPYLTPGPPQQQLQSSTSSNNANAGLSPSPSSASLTRTSSSSGPVLNKPPSPNPPSSSTPTPASFTPSSHSPAPSIASPLTQSTGSPFKPQNVGPSFNPSAHEFSPAMFKPVPRKNAAIQIRKPPAAGPSAIEIKKPIPVVPAQATVSEQTQKADADAKQADEERARAAAKAKAEEAAKAEELAKQQKAEEEAKQRAIEEEKAREAEEARLAAEKKQAEEAEQQKLAQEKRIAEEKEQAAEEERKREETARQEREDQEAREKERREAEAEAKAKSDAEAKAKAESDAQSSVEDDSKPSEASQTAPAQVSDEKPKVEESNDAPITSTPLETVQEGTVLSSEAGEIRRKSVAPLDLTHANASSTAPPPTPGAALKTAVPIADLDSVSYPSSIQSPRPDLNAGAEPGKYRYDRDFLLQFMDICRERPEQLPSLEAIGMAEADGSAFTPGQSARLGNAARRISGPVPQIGGRSMANVPRAGMPMPAMGTFGKLGSGAALTSEQRFAQSTAAAGFGQAFPGVGRPASGRQMSMGGMGLPGGGSGRVGSQRGSKRRGGGGNAAPSYGTPPMGSSDGFASLQTTENAWSAGIQSNNKQPVDPTAPEIVNRKVKALLNKLTMENFDSISNQILDWANKSEQETDGRILRQVIALIFEKATDEAAWSEMYALLCRKLHEQVSQSVTDMSLSGPDGQPGVSGGFLFRKYLLNRCQEDYEKGWSEKMKAAAAASSKASEDKAKQEANEKTVEAAKEAASTSSAPEPKEAELLSDEYYAAQKAKRRGLGLVRFIGELYKLQMLTARIMHECIKKLLTEVNDPEEDDMESLCRLLLTIGRQLEEDDIGPKTDSVVDRKQRARGMMNIYFERLTAIIQSDKISSRIRFMVLDVMDTRKAGWQTRNTATGPKTIAQIHDDAAKQEAEAKRAASSGGRLPSMQDQFGRHPSRRGQSRSDIIGPDGWSIAGSGAPPAPARTKAGDLSHFGKLRGSASGTERGLGVPNNVFSRGKNLPAKEKEAAPGPAANPFAALANADASDASGSGGERPKLALLKRTVPLEGEDEEGSKTDDGEGDAETEAESRQEMDPEAIKRSIKNSVPEYLANKNVEEGVDSFRELPANARSDLVKEFATEVVHKREADVQLVADLFAAISEAELVSAADFKAGFGPLIVELDDLATDVPKAYTFCGLMLVGSKLTEEDVRELSETMEAEELDEAKEKLMDTFTKCSST